MKKFIGILVLGLLLISPSANAGSIGSGELKFAPWLVDYFIKYLKGSYGQKPLVFVVATDGSYAMFWYCPEATCAPGNATREVKACEQKAKTECKIFATRRTVKWKNGINPGKTKFNSKWSKEEIRAKLTEIGFLGTESESFVTKKTEKKKEEKKTEKKVTSKTVSGERALALHWEGYQDLIAGTIKFNENNNKGNIKLTLPNNDGSCEGSYSLQEGGKGTWQIACTNGMGAAGTLKWGDSGTTGIGRDYKDKKVKFTVAKKS